MPNTRRTLLQSYVNRLYEQVYAPPFRMDETNLTAIVIRAQKEKLQDLVDREVNTPWCEAFKQRGVLHRFAPVGAWFVLALLDVHKLRPSDADFQPTVGGAESTAEERIRKIGLGTTARQREMILMIPVEDQGLSATNQVGTQRWYVPLVLNDFVPSIISGRELYGYPKVFGEFVIDGDARAGDKTFGTEPGWRTLTIRAHGPKLPENNGPQAPHKDDQTVSYELKLVDVLEIVDPDAPQEDQAQTADAPKAEDNAPVPSSGRWKRIGAWFGRVRRTWRHRSTRPASAPAHSASVSAGDPAPAASAVVRPPGTVAAEADQAPDQAVLPEQPARKEASAAELSAIDEALREKAVEYMFLRQFRDPCEGDLASYQAVVLGSIGLQAGVPLVTLQRTPRRLQITVPVTPTHIPSLITASLGIDGQDINVLAVYEASGLRLAVFKPEIVWDRP